MEEKNDPRSNMSYQICNCEESISLKETLNKLKKELIRMSKHNSDVMDSGICLDCYRLAQYINVKLEQGILEE